MVPIGETNGAFSFQQLRTLVTNTPKLSYLLYDKGSQFADSQEWPTSQENENERFRGKQFYVRTVDANFLKQYKSLRGYLKQPLS